MRAADAWCDGRGTLWKEVPCVQPTPGAWAESRRRSAGRKCGHYASVEQTHSPAAAYALSLVYQRALHIRFLYGDRAGSISFAPSGRTCAPFCATRRVRPRASAAAMPIRCHLFRAVLSRSSFSFLLSRPTRTPSNPSFCYSSRIFPFLRLCPPRPDHPAWAHIAGTYQV